jgi:hypothetical protein
MARKIIKYLFITVGTAVALIVLVVAFAYFKNMPTFLDKPKHLSKQTEAIEVYYVAWACDCADWIETKFEAADRSYETKEEDCIFIEPTSEEVKIPDSFYFNHFKKVRLVGRFYLDKGIPSSYEMKTEEKPDKAKVFQYDKFEIIENEE